MSGHHGHHRPHFPRSRMSHHSSSSYHRPIHHRHRMPSRNQVGHLMGPQTSQQSINSGVSNNSNYNHNHIGNSGTSNNGINIGNNALDGNKSSDWSEHRSSSGKVYYYNTRTGISQWEIPNELRQQQQQQHHHNHHHHDRHHLQQHHHQQPQQHQHHQQQQQQPESPESELSESSSIRQHQDKSPSSNSSSRVSTYSDQALPEDKPLLTPSLAHYYKPELLIDKSSSHVKEQQANQLSRESSILDEKILQISAEIKMAKSLFNVVDIHLEAQERKTALLMEAGKSFGFA